MLEQSGLLVYEHLSPSDIQERYFKNRKELNFDYSGGSINYNFEESANRYEDNMNKLRGGK